MLPILEKPWGNDDIILNIKNGIERTRLKEQLKNKIEELEIANKKLNEYSKSLEEKVEERTKDLNISNIKLNTILENLADALILFDSNNRIVQANEQAKKLFCTNKNDELKGKNFFELIINEKNKKFQKDEKTLRDYTIIDYRNNRKIPVEINLANVVLNDEENTIALIRDITFQKENERLRDDFIATLTHDLRTPLLASINALDFTLNGELGNVSDELKELLSVMKKSSEDMLGLVDRKSVV